MFAPLMALVAVSRNKRRISLYKSIITKANVDLPYTKYKVFLY